MPLQPVNQYWNFEYEFLHRLPYSFNKRSSTQQQIQKKKPVASFLEMEKHTHLLSKNIQAIITQSIENNKFF